MSRLRFSKSVIGVVGLFASKSNTSDATHVTAAGSSDAAWVTMLCWDSLVTPQGHSLGL